MPIDFQLTDIDPAQIDLCLARDLTNSRAELRNTAILRSRERLGQHMEYGKTLAQDAGKDIFR